MDTKKQVFYMHGGDAFTTQGQFLEHLQNCELRGTSEPKTVRWSHTLRETLGESYEVFTPEMPNKQNAHYEEWKIWFEKHFEHMRDDVVLVGWSLGGIFMAKYLSENEVPFTIKHLFMLAAPFHAEGLTDIECGDFLLNPELIGAIPEKVGGVTLMHSTDDFVVPYDHALLYQKLMITADLATFSDRNHFLVEQLPELIEAIAAL